MAAPMANVNIEFIQNKGKSLVSKTKFQQAEVIFEEKPLVCAQFSWNELYKYVACENCLKSLETANETCRRLSGNPSITLPYPECCDVDPSLFAVCPDCQILFCSSECRDEAIEKYHLVLCMGTSKNDPNHPLYELQNQWRSFHYPPETTSIMLIAKIIAMVKQSKDKDAVISQFSGFVKKTINDQEDIAHKLLGQEFEVQRDVLRNLLMKALYEESLQEWFTSNGFKSLFALIGTNGQGIGSNSFSRWIEKVEKLPLTEKDKQTVDDIIDTVYAEMDEVSGVFLDCEGSGLYKLQSTCNHSCIPNAEISFRHGNSTLSLVALRDIAEEEEITISYLSPCDLGRGRHSRQKILKENYLFTCACDKCVEQAGDASDTSDDDDDEDEMEDD